MAAAELLLLLVEVVVFASRFNVRRLRLWGGLGARDDWCVWAFGLARWD